MADGSGFKIEPAAEPEDRRGPPQRDRIVAAVINAGVAFWSDPDGYAFATVPIRGHIERHRVRSRRFALIVRSLYGAANPSMNKHVIGTLPGSVSDAAMAEAMPQFEAMALANRIAREPDVRVIRDNGAIWLDLGDPDWTTIRIDGQGWRIVDKAMVPLVRPDGVRPLPKPTVGDGAIAELRRIVNVDDDADFVLIVSWLVAAIYPDGPFPVLALDGEQGSGKSTISKMLRRLVDPNKAEHRAAPRTEDDLLIAAVNGRVVALDNVSFIDPDMADAICRLATGAGFSKRRLYSDGEEIIVSVARPVLLNGIPSLLARGDLADRALAVTLPPIPDDARLPESEVWAAFDLAAPGILAALLDGLATALRNLPTLRLDRLPRMADFARLACAAAPAFGWTADAVLSAIEGNRAAAVTAVLDADPVAGALRDLVVKGAWTGTATELLAEVNRTAPTEVQRERGWPKDAARLSARIKRVAPALRRAGIDVTHDRAGHDRRRTVTVRPLREAKTASAASAASASAENWRNSAVFDADAAADAPAETASAHRPPDAADDSVRASVRMSVRKESVLEQQTNGHADGADAADAVFPYLTPAPWEATL